MMITVKLRCDYIQELSGGVRDADGCGAGREEGGRGEAEKGKGAMFSLRSNISCEEGSTSWAGGEGRGAGGGGVIKSVHS